MPKQIILIFRNDDFSALSNRDNETRIMDLFMHFGIPQTQFIIPHVFSPKTSKYYSLTENKEFYECIKRWHYNKCINIGLHGYTHRINKQYKAHRTEFCCLSFDEQNKRIKAGKNLLTDWFGVIPNVFAAPYNSFDRNTVLALEASNFKVFSAMSLENSSVKTISNNVLFIDANLRLSQVRKLGCLPERKDPYIFVVIYHSYMIKKKNDLRDLERALYYVRQSKDIVVSDFISVYENYKGILKERLKYEKKLEETDFILEFHIYNKQKKIFECYPLISSVFDKFPIIREPIVNLMISNTPQSLIHRTKKAQTWIKRLIMAERTIFLGGSIFLNILFFKILKQLVVFSGFIELITFIFAATLTLMFYYVSKKGYFGYPGFGERKKKIFMLMIITVLFLMIDLMRRLIL